MDTSPEYQLAKQFQRIANRPLNVRTALRQMSESERRALAALVARVDAIERRLAAEREVRRKELACSADR